MANNIWWDTINKWLCIGRFTIMLGDWLNWFPKYPPKCPTIREWNMFSITWDNGAWWGMELNETQNFSISRMDGELLKRDHYTKKFGKVSAYFQIIILGIGIRYNYEKNLIVISKDFDKDEAR